MNKRFDIQLHSRTHWSIIISSLMLLLLSLSFEGCRGSVHGFKRVQHLSRPANLIAVSMVSGKLSLQLYDFHKGTITPEKTLADERGYGLTAIAVPPNKPYFFYGVNGNLLKISLSTGEILKSTHFSEFPIPEDAAYPVLRDICAPASNRLLLLINTNYKNPYTAPSVLVDWKIDSLPSSAKIIEDFRWARDRPLPFYYDKILDEGSELPEDGETSYIYKPHIENYYISNTKQDNEMSDYSPDFGWLFSDDRVFYIPDTPSGYTTDFYEGLYAVWGKDGDVYYVTKNADLVMMDLDSGEKETLFSAPPFTHPSIDRLQFKPVMNRDRTLLAYIYMYDGPLETTPKGLLIFDLTNREYISLKDQDVRYLHWFETKK